MASRLYTQFRYSLEKYVVDLWGHADIGASGAVSAVAGGGISNVVKEATAGQYTIVLEDKYNRLLDVDVKIMDDAVTSVAQVQILQNPATVQADFVGDKSVTIQCLDFAGAAVNPASGARLVLHVTVRNTQVGPYDV